MTNRLTSCFSSRTFSNCFSRFLPLGLAAASAITFAILTLSAAPVRLAAQQPAATVSEQSAATPVNTPPAEQLSQEEQNKAFLTGGPIVKWTARTFKISVETAAAIFQLVNFLVIVLLVAVPMARVFPKIFRKRSITLGQNLQTARAATEDANARLRAVEEKLAGLDGEIKKLQAQVEQESQEDEKRVKASLTEESARIVETAEQELSVAVAQAQRNLRHFAADLAIEQAARQMTLSPEADRALIAEFIGSVADSDGGQK